MLRLLSSDVGVSASFIRSSLKNGYKVLYFNAVNGTFASVHSGARRWRDDGATRRVKQRAMESNRAATTQAQTQRRWARQTTER